MFAKIRPSEEVRRIKSASCSLQLELESMLELFAGLGG